MFTLRPLYLTYDHVGPSVTVEFGEPPAHAARTRINEQIFANFAVPHIDWHGTKMQVFSGRMWGMKRSDVARLSAHLDPQFITVHAIFGTMCDDLCDEFGHPATVQIVPVIPFPVTKMIGWHDVVGRHQVRDGYVTSMYLRRQTNDSFCDTRRALHLCHLRLPGFGLLTGETQPVAPPALPTR